MPMSLTNTKCPYCGGSVKQHTFLEYHKQTIDTEGNQLETIELIGECINCSREWNTIIDHEDQIVKMYRIII